MINYATGYAFNVTELFENFDNKRLSINSSDCQKTIGYPDKREIVLQVFLYAIKLILLDIIQNNVTFKFPTKRECYLNIVRTSGEDFKKARRNGKWLDIDYLKWRLNFQPPFLGFILLFRNSCKVDSLWSGPWR